MAWAGAWPPAVAHLFLARELLHSGIRDAAAAHGVVVGANRMGKVKAALQSVVIAAGLAMPSPSAAAGWISGAAWTVLALSWVFFGVFLARNRDAVFADSARRNP